MKDFPQNTVKVELENKCDVCRKKLARYYNLTYYIHICSLGCFEMFLEKYNVEIDSIALEIVHAKDLKTEDENK